MIKVFKSKLFIGILCLVAAAGIAFGLLPWLYLSRNNTTLAVVAAQDIPAGTTITDEMLTETEVGAYGLPASVCRGKAEAVGMVAAADLYGGEYLTGTRLITAEEHAAIQEDQSKGLSEGLCLVTIQFPGASSGVASVLRSGHIVDVYESVTWVTVEVDPETMERVETEETAVVKVLSSMYVYDVLNSKLQSLTELDERRENALAEGDTDFDFAPAFVVFRCTGDQAAALIRLEHEKDLHLTLQRTGG